MMGLGASVHGNPLRVEERRGTAPDRFARLTGRGREETTPVAAHMLVAGAVGILVVVILAISFVLWLVLR
jgi:hypothetical protein